MKLNLLCTFVHRNDLSIAINWIEQFYEINNDSIFVFKNVQKPYQMYCTFNVIGKYELKENTILIHRKTETNTLYTINALNNVIRSINNGVLDTRMEIPWNNYINSLILTTNGEIVKYNIDLEKVIYLKDN